MQDFVELSLKLRRLDAKKVNSAAEVGKRLEILRVEDAVIFHMIAIDVVMLDRDRFAGKRQAEVSVCEVALDVAELTESCLTADCNRLRKF
jgi:hypothetical protein